MAQPQEMAQPAAYYSAVRNGSAGGFLFGRRLLLGLSVERLLIRRNFRDFEFLGFCGFPDGLRRNGLAIGWRDDRDALFDVCDDVHDVGDFVEFRSQPLCASLAVHVLHVNRRDRWLLSLRGKDGQPRKQ